jgi:hypothetical protein
MKVVVAYTWQRGPDRPAQAMNLSLQPAPSPTDPENGTVVQNRPCLYGTASFQGLGVLSRPMNY